MFTTQKIEASLWPWAYLNSIQEQDTSKWVEERGRVPVLYNLNGISSEHDVRFVFKDLYVDLSLEVERGAQMSERCDTPGYLA